MAREKELYRPYLERLDQVFPDRELLTISDVAKFCGISRQRAKDDFPFEKRKGGKNSYYISKLKFASTLC